MFGMLDNTLTPYIEGKHRYTDSLVAAVRAECPEWATAEFQVSKSKPTVLIGAEQVVKQAMSLTTDHPARPWKLEAELQDFYYAQQLPVSQVTYVGQKSNFFCMKRMPGVSLESVFFLSQNSDGMDNILEEVGAFAANVQKLSLKNTFTTAALPRAVYDSAMIYAMDVFLGSKVAEDALPDFPDAFDLLKDYRAQVKTGQVYCAHGDLANKGNIFVDKHATQVTGFLDFELSVKTQMPEMEIVLLEEVYTPDHAEAIRSGYLKTVPEFAGKLACAQFFRAANDTLHHKYGDDQNVHIRKLLTGLKGVTL